MAIAVIASQQAITASPISAATVALLSMLTGYHPLFARYLDHQYTFDDRRGALLGALYSLRVGKDLEVDPEYLRRLEAGEFDEAVKGAEALKSPWKAAVSGGYFRVGHGADRAVRFHRGATPQRGYDVADAVGDRDIDVVRGGVDPVDYPYERDQRQRRDRSFLPVCRRWWRIFGIAWMGDTFLNGNMTELRASIEGVVTSMPWLFGIALFVMSILLYSQAATVRALMPLGIALGISTVDAGGVVSCRERLFFHSELSDRRRRDQFRPHRYHPDRQIRAESFVHDAGADRNDRGHVDRPVADPVFGTVISAKIFARRFFDFPCQCFLSVSPRLSTGIPSLAPGRIS